MAEFHIKTFIRFRPDKVNISHKGDKSDIIAINNKPDQLNNRTDHLNNRIDHINNKPDHLNNRHDHLTIRSDKMNNT